MATGDDAFDAQVENEIRERLNQGEIWAWASVDAAQAGLGFALGSARGCAFIFVTVFALWTVGVHSCAIAWNDLEQLHSAGKPSQVLTICCGER